LLPIESLEPRQLLAAAPFVDVMTWNVYYGGGSGASIFATAFTDLWKNVQASNIAERAAAIAAQIRVKRPDLVALQEAVIWRTGSVLDTGSAKDVKYDFAAEILKHLTNRRWRYAVVSKVTNADWEIPGMVGGSIKDIRMTDQDVILARVAKGARLRVLGAGHGNYRNRVSINIPVIDRDIDFTRGWASVDAQVGTTGPRFRVVNTHLEVLNQSTQRKQAEELLAGPVKRTKLPVILAGDFNSDANTGGATYRLLTGAGFKDAWKQARPTDPGPTASQDDDLRNRDSKLEFRIDLLMYRGKRLTATAADRIGEDPRDKTPSGLWPSDHAALWSRIQLGRAVTASTNDVLLGRAAVRRGLFRE
jgi:endonuclease/exonuclease/phosphatase family metal-dependent hydrolase